MACSVEKTADGAVQLSMKPCSGNKSGNLRVGSIVVLTLSKPSPKGALEWAQGSWGGGHPGAYVLHARIHVRSATLSTLYCIHNMLQHT